MSSNYQFTIKRVNFLSHPSSSKKKKKGK
uniref:Uncharacterized protein n=1 Tax=Rhizophora mucronata TaxID=61149 RepID=A0A2P2LWP1_RHIMU